MWEARKLKTMGSAVPPAISRVLPKLYSCEAINDGKAKAHPPSLRRGPAGRLPPEHAPDRRRGTRAESVVRPAEGRSGIKYGRREEGQDGQYFQNMSRADNH